MRKKRKPVKIIYNFEIGDKTHRIFCGGGKSEGYVHFFFYYHFLVGLPPFRCNNHYLYTVDRYLVWVVCINSPDNYPLLLIRFYDIDKYRHYSRQLYRTIINVCVRLYLRDKNNPSNYLFILFFNRYENVVVYTFDYILVNIVRPGDL